MRFDFYKILSTNSHIGYPLKKNLLLQGVATHHTVIGINGKVAFYHQIDWVHLFYGKYVLGLVFLYGGHVHLVNTKKEFTGFLKNIFQTFEKKENIHLFNKKEGSPVLTVPLYLNSQKKEKWNLLDDIFPRKKKTLLKDSPKKHKKKSSRRRAGHEPVFFKQGPWKNSKKWVRRLSCGFILKLQKEKGKPYIRSFFKKKKSIKKPIITIHDSGYLPGSISNWAEHVRFSNRYLSIPKKYARFFSQYKKLNEDFTRLKNQSIELIPPKIKNSLNPIQKKKPDVIVVLNSGKEYGILFESFRQSLPVYGTITTYTKKEWIDFPWIGNDTNLYSIILWCRWIARIFQYVQLKRFQKKMYYFKNILSSLKEK